MKIFYIILIFLLIACQNKKNSESKQLNSKHSDSIFSEKSTDSLKLSLSQCPDSAISFELFQRYYSTDLNLDKDILNSYDSVKILLSSIFNLAISIEKAKKQFKIYELFKKQKDSSYILSIKGVSKLVKGLSPNTQEYYVSRNDTLFADSLSPVYYYYDDDSLKMIEEYYYDDTEGCAFKKQIKYFINNKPILNRVYMFFECFGEKEKKKANFHDIYDFIYNNKKFTINKNIDFFYCKFSHAMINYIYSTSYKFSVHDHVENEYIDLEMIK